MPGVLADPTVTVVAAGGATVATNDNWGAASNATQLAASAQQLKKIHWIAYDRCGPFDSSGSATRAGRSDVTAPAMVSVAETAAAAGAAGKSTALESSRGRSPSRMAPPLAAPLASRPNQDPGVKYWRRSAPNCCAGQSS